MNTQDIAERITIIRGKLSRRAFASKINIQENTLRNYEKSLSLPNSDIIASFCLIFSISPEWLILGKGQMYSDANVQPSHAPALKLQNATATSFNSQCMQCAELKKELTEERGERRELARENRQLWKENAELRERSGRCL